MALQHAMPIRDAETGRELSGAARRKLRALRDAPDKVPVKPAKAAKKSAAKKPPVAAAPAEATASPEPAAAEDLGPNPFEGLEAAPISDTSRLITWGAKLHAMVLHQISQDRRAYPNRREWYRALLGGTTSLGVIRDKAMEQQKIDDALRRDEQAGKKQGLSSAIGRKAEKVTRPPS